MPYPIAIDFGTTNSLVVQWADGAALPVQLPGLSTVDLPYLIPSLLYVQDGKTAETTAGHAVQAAGLDVKSDHRLFRSFKRRLLDPTAENQVIDGISWTARDAAHHFIKQLLSALPYSLNEIEQLVLTAPVTAFDRYQAWLTRTVQPFIVDPDRIRIVDESTAAALGYAITEPKALVLVFDFGGGSLDLSLVQLPDPVKASRPFASHYRKNTPQVAEVIGKAGCLLGGSDIDQWILAEMLQQDGASQAISSAERAALITQCEQAKIKLTSQKHTEFDLTSGSQTRSVRLTRSQLDDILQQHHFESTVLHTLDEALSRARQKGVFQEDIDCVLMVGGMSLMPAVRQLVKTYFTSTEVRTHKPFTAVAEGALQVAAGYGLDDYLYYGYALRYWDSETQQHAYVEIIPAGTRFPSPKPVEIELGAAHPNQTAIEFVMAEITTPSISHIDLRYEDEQPVFVAQASPQDQRITPFNLDRPPAAQLQRKGLPQEKRIKAAFSLDAQHRLHVTVTDLKSRKKLMKDATIETDHGEIKESTSTVTGLEPGLTTAHPKGVRRLPLKQLGTLLSGLPATVVSLNATAALLQSRDAAVRYAAARMLCERADPAARTVLQEVLAHGDSPARATVARHLHRLSWFSAHPLIDRALQDVDERIREAVIYALCDARHLNAYSLLVHTLANEGDRLRAAVARGLAGCQDAAAVPVLAMVLQAGDPAVRCQGLEALGANHSTEAIALAVTALHDPHPDVVYNAVLSLIELRSDQSIVELAPLIVQTSGPCLEAILRGLFHATNYLHLNLSQSAHLHSLLDALAHALNDVDLPNRLAAVWPLAGMHAEAATKLLTEAFFHDPVPEMRAHILRVMTSLMTIPSDHELVAAGLQSDEPLVRETAHQIRGMSTMAAYREADAAAQPLTHYELAGRTSPPRDRKNKR